MSRVLEISGFIFYFFSADCAERAHVHVKKGNGRGKIWILPEIEIFYLKGYKVSEQRKIINLVRENHSLLTEYWDAYCNN